VNAIDFCHLVGLGGTGGALCEPLARLLRFHKNAGDQTELTFWDGDKHEEDNDERQAGQVGANKAHYWQERASRGLIVNFQPRYFEEADAQKVARDPRPGLIVLAVDNFWTRRKVLEALRGRRAPMLVVLPGNEATQGSCLVQAYPINPTVLIQRGADGDILTWHPEIAKAHDGIAQNGPGCSVNQAREPQTIAANFTAAACVLWAVTNYLDGEPVAPSLSFDFRRGEVQRV
jgi:hypothetical protein